jgi:hypothetical protein
MWLLLTLLFDIPISGIDCVITKAQSGIGDGSDNGDGKVLLIYPAMTYQEIIRAN